MSLLQKSDIGMLISLYGRATKIRLLSNDQNIKNGAKYENVVVQKLKAHGFECTTLIAKKQAKWIL